MSAGKDKEMDPTAEVRSQVRYHCIWCKKWGKWIDIGSRPWALEQILCDPCLRRGEPPHYKYLKKLLPPSLTDEISRAIAGFAYEPVIKRFACDRQLPAGTPLRDYIVEVDPVSPQ